MIGYNITELNVVPSSIGTGNGTNSQGEINHKERIFSVQNASAKVNVSLNNKKKGYFVWIWDLSLVLLYLSCLPTCLQG